jgi:Glycosyltransferase family 87
VHLYRVFSARMLAGQLPYRDFFVEYQPGSIPAFIVPGLISQQHYQFVFRLEMALLGGLALVVAAAAAAAAGFTRRQLWRAAAGIGLLPFALGPTVLNGFDLWPTALTVIAVLALVLGRNTTAAGVVGLGAATKVFPVALLPLVLVAALRRSGREGLRRAGGAFVAVAVLANAFFLVVGPGGLRFSYWVQAKRGLEDQSLLGSLLMALDHAGITHVAFAMRPPGSVNAVGALGQALGVVTTVLEVGALVLVSVLFARRRPSADSTITASAAAVAGFIAFGKVFSAQYLVWLLPLVPLVRGVRGLAAWVALVVAAAVTSLWVLSVVDPFAPSDAIWLVVFRNLLVVGLYALLVSALRSDPEKVQTSTLKPAAQSTNSSGKLA